MTEVLSPPEAKPGRLGRYTSPVALVYTYLVGREPGHVSSSSKDRRLGQVGPTQGVAGKAGKTNGPSFPGLPSQASVPSAFTLIPPGPLPLFILPLHWTSIGLEQGPRTSRDLEFWNSVRL